MLTPRAYSIASTKQSASRLNRREALCLIWERKKYDLYFFLAQ